MTRGRSWEPEEEAAVLACAPNAAAFAALGRKIGRSVLAVKTRRSRLNKNPCALRPWTAAEQDLCRRYAALRDDAAALGRTMLAVASRARPKGD